MSEPMPPVYIQIFSMTDHTQPLNGRLKGPYSGINAGLQTSEFSNGVLKISESAKSAQGELDRPSIEGAAAIIAYRHSDTGILQGTSESLISVAKTPWTDMPGFELKSIHPKGAAELKLWIQEMKLTPGQLTRVHFGKTIVYLKNWGRVEKIEWVTTDLTEGPSQLHAEPVTHDLTIAPPSGSGIVVKMGQETEK
jgi:hypothetical protein